jgi:hypothetical protein
MAGVAGHEWPGPLARNDQLHTAGGEDAIRHQDVMVFFVIYPVDIGTGFISFQLAPPPAEKAKPETG